jgi:putative transposase
MGNVGATYDKAMCESFFATLEGELLPRTSFCSYSKARLARLELIEGLYNSHRLHSALDTDQSPSNYEKEYLAAA